MRLDIVGQDSARKSFRQEMADYIRGNFSGILGDDVALLDSDAGLAELSRKTLSMYRDAVKKAA